MSVIDDYLKTIPPAQRAELQRVRKLILKTVPDATETISYGMPVFKYQGKYLIGISAFKNHMSLFPGSGPIAELKERLTEFKTARGTIQFTLEKPIPEVLVVAIVERCLAAITSPKTTT